MDMGPIMEAGWMGLTVALIGFMGVLVGAGLATRRDQRNWRLQEAMKAYAALFPAGRKEIELCGSLAFGGDIGNDEMIEVAREKQPALVDSPFLQLLSQCWLLETDEGIRAALEDIGENYGACRIAAGFSVKHWRLQKALGQTTNPQDRAQIDKGLEHALERSEQGPEADDVLTALDQLKQNVATRYFHRRNRLASITRWPRAWMRRRREGGPTARPG